MFYRTNNKIVSINNVKEITLQTFGSGAKSNPFQYTIRIDYFGEENVFLEFHSNKALAEQTLEEIFEILTKTP